MSLSILLYICELLLKSYYNLFNTGLIALKIITDAYYFWLKTENMPNTNYISEKISFIIIYMKQAVIVCELCF